MRIIADTNLLVRLVINDDTRQVRAAAEAMSAAAETVVGTQALCELVWVLRSRYGIARGEIAAWIRGLLATRNLVMSRAAVEAGLAMLEAGGDFADGVIAFEGRMLGGETFVSFDRRAVERLQALGVPAQAL